MLFAILQPARQHLANRREARLEAQYAQRWKTLRLHGYAHLDDVRALNYLSSGVWTFNYEFQNA